MAIDDSTLTREIQAIVDRGYSLSHCTITARIRAGDRWIDPLKIDRYTLARDYEGGYGDIRTLDLQIPKGEYAYRLVPQRDRLWVDLTIIPFYENTSIQRETTQARVVRYRAILIDQDNTVLTDRSPQASSEEDLNTSGLHQVQLQLIDEGLYQTRLMTVGGCYRKIRSVDVLRSLLTQTTQFVDSNNQQAILGVDVLGKPNPQLRNQIVVPHGIKLTKLARFLQTEEGGIYPTGIGCYLQSKYWRVFPCYDTQSYRNTPKTLTVISLPPNRFLGSERTYRRTDNQVIILVADQVEINDPGLHSQLNEGNAVRFTAPDSLLSGHQVQGRDVSVKRQQLLGEVKGQMDTGFTNAQWSETRATDNPLKEYSKFAQRNGMYLKVRWNYADVDLLYPGMPVKYIVAANGVPIELHGTLLGVQETRVAGDTGVVATRYPGVCDLKLFLSRNEQL